MNRIEATKLRNLIVRYFKSAPLLAELTTKLKAKGIEDWALSVDDVMALNPNTPDHFYMRQIEKIALLIGCSPKDGKELAVESYANMVKQGEI